MATPYSNLSLQLLTNEGKYNRQIQDLIFYDSEIDFLEVEHKLVNIYEFDTLIILNNSLDPAEFEIDGIDEYAFDSETFEFTHKKYKNHDFPVIVFEFDKGMEPLVPGYYQITATLNGKVYFSWFEVLSKNIDINDLNSIREEIEDLVSGLALNVQIANVAHYAENYSFTDIPKYIEQSQFFLNNTHLFNKLLFNIRLNPKYHIAKDYHWDLTGKKVQIDNKSVRKMLSVPNRRGLVYGFKRYDSYDTYENILLKYDLTKLHEIMMKVLNFLSDYVRELEKAESINTYRNEKSSISFLSNSIKLLKKLDFQFIMTLKESWLYAVPLLSSKDIGTKQPTNHNYRMIHRLYLGIAGKTGELKLNHKYRFYWKNSALLYEIWGYLKVVESLKTLGFLQIGGWLYSHSMDNELPFLHDNEWMTFRKGNVKLRAVYNGTIANNDSKTSYDNPLKTHRKNNKPDIRIDIYKDKERRFLGSIILDTKYRSLKNIWNGHSNSREQIYNYRDIQSEYHLKQSNYLTELQKPVVVGVIYPKDSKELGKNKIEALEKSINFIKLTPSIGSENLVNYIEEKIQGFIVQDEMFYR